MNGEPERSPLKATAELVNTHQVVRKLLEGFSIENPRFEEILKTLRRAVEAHAWLQEQFLVPALHGKALIDKSFLAELAQEHRDLDHLLELALRTPPGNRTEVEAYALQVQVIVQTHFKKETDVLYPLVEQALDAGTLTHLRDEMNRRKSEIREVVAIGRR